MRTGFDLIFFLDRIDRIFSPTVRRPSAEGRLIRIILLILSNCFFKNENPFLFIAVIRHSSLIFRFYLKPLNFEP